MRTRLPLVLSTLALLVALLGATSLGHAAGTAMRAVPPFAKTSGFARLADNSTKLNGRKSTLRGLPGTIPVVGANGKLPASIGAVGPQGSQGSQGAMGPRGLTGPVGPKGLTGSTGPAGPAGPAGPQGPPGPTGVSGWQTVTKTQTWGAGVDAADEVDCPAGKKALGGGVAGGIGILSVRQSAPGGALGDKGWFAEVVNTWTHPTSVTLWVICAFVS